MKISKEEKALLKQQEAENREYRKYIREYKKKEKEELRHHKFNMKREGIILKFMIKNDVKYFHHGRIDSKMDEIKKAFAIHKNRNVFQEYHPYIWNYRGEGNNYLELCSLNCLFRSSEFKTIYDVPLDGSYFFYIYDSGQRGCGSFDHISVYKKNEEPWIPKVNPGGLIPTIIY